MGPFSTDSDFTNVALSDNWIARANLVNEFGFGLSRANFSYTYPQAAMGDQIVAQAGKSMRE